MSKIKYWISYIWDLLKSYFPACDRTDCIFYTLHKLSYVRVKCRECLENCDRKFDDDGYNHFESIQGQIMRTEREKTESIKRGKANRRARAIRQEAQDRQDMRDRQAAIRERRKQSNWQLNRVDDIAWTQDDSGIYTYINWDAGTNSVRLDIMTETKAEPLQSFTGDADNVRKAAMKWFVSALYDGPYNPDLVSLEHAAYIGAELERCDTERIDYVQD